MATDLPRGSLMGLPTELRLRILEHLYRKCIMREFFVVFHLYNNLYRRWSATSLLTANRYLDISSTCRQLYEEASDVFYSRANVTVCVMGMEKPEDEPWRNAIGRPEDLRLWRSVKKLRLEILMEPGSTNKQVILERVKKFAGEVMEGGRYLNSLQIAFRTAEDEGLPSYFEEVVGALTVLKVRGKVRVVFADDEDDDEDVWSKCEGLEKSIER